MKKDLVEQHEIDIKNILAFQKTLMNFAETTQKINERHSQEIKELRDKMGDTGINLVEDIDELKKQMQEIYRLLAEHLVKHHGIPADHFNKNP